MSDVGQMQNLDDVIGAYRAHQRRTRGLADATLRNYESQARLFVRATLGADPVDLSELTPADVVAFVSSLATRWAPSSMKTSRTALRSFLRYLSVQGVSDGRLDEVVPRVAHWRLSSLPLRLSDPQLEQLLASLQDVGGRPCGPRDRAIVRCLATLGLRPAEIARLRLEDLDWRAATLALVRRKNRRGQVLPLPGEVGEAIADYLHEHRPVTKAREVFVQQVGPRRGEPIGATAVSEVVARALERAGVEASMAGAYVLRHTVASRMVARGVSLKEVADFLGHRDLDTAGIYTCSTTTCATPSAGCTTGEPSRGATPRSDGRGGGFRPSAPLSVASVLPCGRGPARTPSTNGGVIHGRELPAAAVRGGPGPVRLREYRRCP